MIETMTATTAPAPLPRFWAWCRGSRDLHRFRHGDRTALCGLTLAPGAKPSDDPPLQARPCGTCTRIAHEELGR